jgi:hypothetical protein
MLQFSVSTDLISELMSNAVGTVHASMVSANLPTDTTPIFYFLRFSSHVYQIGW